MSETSRTTDTITLCPLIFKGSACGYVGPTGVCDKRFETCRDLGNQERFTGQPERTELFDLTSKLKQYALFAGYGDAEVGGWTDFKGSYETQEDAIAWAMSGEGDFERIRWWHVVDLENGEIVSEDLG